MEERGLRQAGFSGELLHRYAWVACWLMRMSVTDCATISAAALAAEAPTNRRREIMPRSAPLILLCFSGIELKVT